MQTILLVIHLLLAVSLIGAVLMQRSEGGALGMGGGGGGAGGGGGGLFSARGTANALTRTTAILAACFMTTSLLLAILASNTTESGSILDNAAPITAPLATPETPSEPSVPLSN